MNSTTIRLALAGAAAVLASCSSAPVVAPAPAAPAPQVAAAPAPLKATPAPVPAPLPAYLDPNSPIHNDHSVYFAYDNYTVNQDAAALIERHGKYLASMPALKIQVSGNADERGSTEYNLALGQKRAEAVVKALKIQGVKDAQLEAVSWGEEKPKASGHDEAAWKQNRRADLDYPSK